MSSSYSRFASATTCRLISGIGVFFAASSLYRSRTCAIPQKRFTAVGRVFASVSQMTSTSLFSSAIVVAEERSMPSATPIAADTPMAIAPRTIMSLMARATSV